MSEGIGNAEIADLDGTVRIHPDAQVCAGSSVGPFCQLEAGARVAAGASLSSHVVMGRDVRVGSGSVIGSGVFLCAGTVIGKDVAMGPNAVVVDPEFRRVVDGPVLRPTLVGDGASIGANATVFSGVSIGAHAVVGANSMVNRDVPPFAKVVGSPAHIVGYQTSPDFATKRHLRASIMADDEFPAAIGSAVLSRMPLIVDIRSGLSFGEVPTHLPFVPQRYFIVYDVSSREVRGEHAHRELHELLICVHGECSVAIDDGAQRGEFLLDRPDVALHLPPMVWSRQYRYSADAVLLVLCSHPYEADDYIRDYSEFNELIEHG